MQIVGDSGATLVGGAGGLAIFPGTTFLTNGDSGLSVGEYCQ